MRMAQVPTRMHRQRHCQIRQILATSLPSRSIAGTKCVVADELPASYVDVSHRRSFHCVSQPTVSVSSALTLAGRSASITLRLTVACTSATIWVGRSNKQTA
jgi:hypothetical protein